MAAASRQCSTPSLPCQSLALGGEAREGEVFEGGQGRGELQRKAALEERRQAYLIFAFSLLVIFSSIVCIQPFAVLSFKK